MKILKKNRTFHGFISSSEVIEPEDELEESSDKASFVNSV
jgi:hypothetical protein